MLALNPDLINSCRVCRSPNQDGDYQSLYQSSNKHEETSVLSEAGVLYEQLLDISLNVRHFYPQFLCNSCDLQMKLFKKLKDKAYKTLEYLENLYDQMHDAKENMEQEALYYSYIESQQKAEAQDYQEGLEKYAGNDFEVYQESETNEYESNIDNEYEENAAVEILSENQDIVNEDEENIILSDTHELFEIGSASEECEADNLNDYSIAREAQLERDHLYTEADICNSNTQQEIEIHGKLANKFIMKTETAEDITQDSLISKENIPNIGVQLEPVVDKNDYVTEIYKLLDDESKVDIHSENNDILLQYELYAEENCEDISAFSVIEYITEESMDNGRKKLKLSQDCKRNIVSTTSGEREYKCTPCELEFKSSEEHKLHRTQVHNKKYPCSVCSKELKTMSSLQQHMKMHNEPAYQCEICEKTFSQKFNYQYHMNGHNNVRNFKCNLCEKAFISKADLKVHLRLHTGQRPYVCNICGKDYLMMDHLKTHLLTHTDQYFQCDICNNKFTTHKTLRLHVRTIHSEEPRFKCTICLKPFRRKHHLQYHMKLHQKNPNYLDSCYEMVDNPEVEDNVMNDLVDLSEQESVDDPGFIALSDDVKII